MEAQAKAGDAEAQYALAARLSGESRFEEAAQWLNAAAAQDHPQASFTLAAARLAGVPGVAADAAAGVSGLERAAWLGAAAAARLLAALHAGGVIVPQSWERAANWLAPLVEAGDQGALEDAAGALLIADAGDADAAAIHRRDATVDCSRIAARLRAFAPPKPPPADESICTRPSIRVARGAFSPTECRLFASAGKPRLQPAEIFDDRQNRPRLHPMRTAWNATFTPGALTVPAALIRLKLCALADVDPANAEPINLLRYRRGEEYRPHHDFLAETEDDFKQRGQRVRTALIYLNDRYEGGETHFLTPDIRFRGAIGDVVVFDNVDGAGKVDVTARHASLPIRSGEKWLASLWIRDRAYRY